MVKKATKSLGLEVTVACLIEIAAAKAGD